jgi:hypothetical protein
VTTEETASGPDITPIALEWVGVSALAPVHVNQMIARLGIPTANGAPDGIHLTFGFISPPVLFGDEHTRAGQIAALNGRLTVHAVAEYVISKERVSDLISVLQETLGNYERNVAAAKEGHHA